MPEAEAITSRRRGVGRGSNFFVLDRQQWEKLWAIDTANRLNLVSAFLVLLAGTGADHRLTKWSAKACEEHAGMGKPRAKVAIDQLINAGLIELTEASTRMFPQYRFAAPDPEVDPIFLPTQLVTGFGKEVSILRRIRQSGDAALLRMLVDLYGLIEVDAPFGVSLATLKHYHAVEGSSSASAPPQKVTETGANAIWALSMGDTRQGTGNWRSWHTVEGKNVEQPFWPRVNVLRQIGALRFEPWVFDSASDDAEPLFPVAIPGFETGEPKEEIEDLTTFVRAAANELIGEERQYFITQYAGRLLVTLPAHHAPPALRGVARLRVEADTPGRRLAYAKRMSAIEGWKAGYRQAITSFQQKNYGEPVRRVGKVFGESL